MELDEINYDEIVLVGELTTSNGPFDEDHFLILIFRDGLCLEIPLFTTAEPVLAELKAKRDIAFEAGLTFCTEFESRVFYPDSLKGKHLWEFRAQKFPNIFARIAQFGIPNLDQDMTPEVKDYLSAKRAAVTNNQ